MTSPIAGNSVGRLRAHAGHAFAPTTPPRRTAERIGNSDGEPPVLKDDLTPASNASEVGDPALEGFAACDLSGMPRCAAIALRLVESCRKSAE